MGHLKETKALAAELQASVGEVGEGEPNGIIIARCIGNALLSLALIATLLEQAAARE
jgi:hypothetical protein